MREMCPAPAPPGEGKAGRPLLGEFSDQANDRTSHNACEATLRKFDAKISPSFIQPITMFGSNAVFLSGCRTGTSIQTTEHVGAL